MRATVFAAFAAMFLLARSTAAQETVMRSLDRDRLVIEGAETFTAEQISQALWTDLDVAIAGIMPCSSGEQLRILVEKAIAGYRYAGFPRVEVSLNAAGELLTIDEGPRFMAGAVRVEGAKAIDAARLINALKPPPPDASATGPYWPTGKPAWFDRATEARLAEGIATLLADQGYYRASFFLRTECDDASNTADLVIELADEGEPSTVAELRFLGNRNNAPDEILAYLGIGEETILTGDLRGQMVSKLNASGRLVRCEWLLDELSQRVDGWQPKLTVEEYLVAPALRETLSREEAALIKFSQWVAAFDASDEEITLSFHGPDEWTDVVIASREGFIALNGECGDDRQPSSFRTAAVMSETRFGLYSVLQRRKIAAVPPPAHMTANGSVTVVGGAPKWDGRSALMFGAGMHSKARNGTRRHLKLHLAQTASGALSVLRKHQAVCSWEGDELTACWNGRTLRIDATSGRLIEHVVIDKPEEADKAEQAKAPASVVRMRTTCGEYARRLAEVDALTGSFENRADAARPLSCVAELVFDELKATGRLDELPACQRAAPVFKKLSSEGLFKPLDDLLLMIKEPSTERFQIPAPPGTMTRFNDVQSAIKWLATYLGLWSGDSIFGHQGWLTNVWRGEAVFLARGQLATPGSFGDAPLGGFPRSSSRGGPLWALSVAQLLHWQSLDTAATSYAQQGLRMLSARDFQGDYRELLSANTLAGEYLLGIAEALRTLDPGEVKALADALIELRVLSAKTAQQGGTFLNLLHAADQVPTDQAIAQALDRCWKFGLSGWVDERLQHLADLPYSEAPAFAAAGQPAPVMSGPPALVVPIPPTADGQPAALGAVQVYNQRFAFDGNETRVLPPASRPAAYYPSSPAPGANARYGAATNPGSAGAASSPYGAATYDPTENGPRVYGPARPRTGSLPDYVPDALPAADDRATNGDKVREQIERLQALVRSLAYRVAELEARVPPASDDAVDELREAKQPQGSDTK